MKKLLTTAAITLMTGALLDPLAMSMLERPISWLLDMAMLAAGIGCIYLLVRFRDEL